MEVIGERPDSGRSPHLEAHPMPLLDHFRAPLRSLRHWESLHASWAGSIQRQLNEDLLPSGYFAEIHVHHGSRVEIDVATYEESLRGFASGGGGVATWAPPVPSRSLMKVDHPDLFEVRILTDRQGPELVAAIELVSPSNKDRPANRKAFAVKCGSYLHSGVGLVVVDIVTDRAAELHADLLYLLDADGPPLGNLFAASYRTVSMAESRELEYWPEVLVVGAALPTLPLWIAPDVYVPLDLEQTYADACQVSRIF